jgi:hypothetical protein
MRGKRRRAAQGKGLTTRREYFPVGSSKTSLFLMVVKPLTLENAVGLDCDRLPLETERFFQKSGLTVVVTTASPLFRRSQIPSHPARSRRIHKEPVDPATSRRVTGGGSAGQG